MAQNILHGIPISGGIAIGKLIYMQHQDMDELSTSYIPYSEISREQNRFAAAVAEAEQSFERALASLPDHLVNEGDVIYMHKMLCRDPKLIDNTNANIELKLLSAESALQRALEEIAREFAEIEDDFFRETVNDLHLVGERIMDKLTGKDPYNLKEGEPVILMARDLSPADTIELSLDNVLAMVTEDGGKTSHAGILARSMGIPAVVGVVGLGLTVRMGDTAIVDGLKGTILLNPTEEEKARYTESAQEYERYKEKISQKCLDVAETLDGHRVEVMANVGWVEEIPKATLAGAEGVGLYRTEYAFLNRTSMPTEAELFKEYSDAVQALEGKSVCFRTLDLGSDKQAPALEHQPEANPALGLRATRYCLRHPQLFRAQLRALLRACAGAHASLMFPLVADLTELRKIAHIVSEVRQELADQKEIFARDISMGVMVELPSTVILADALAEEIDFFSIGTNDLTQYTLGVDRANAQVSHLYQPLHPTVLHSIRRVVDVAHQSGIPVNVCGEMAADPYCLPVLLGMPVDTVSMSSQAIPGIKSLIRQLSLEECLELVRDLLKANTTSRVNRMVREFVYSKTKGEMAFHFSHLDGGYE
ncbi:MAG: phosphoenolpyruvate--protein phosphotransferase [Desulfovibrionaceae bacterium]|nr:phosphoenolpyruvate--protein phosphotransferase [Desulfovibrionaceae bacterium]